jgi:hypothetical protein
LACFFQIKNAGAGGEILAAFQRVGACREAWPDYYHYNQKTTVNVTFSYFFKKTYPLYPAFHAFFDFIIRYSLLVPMVSLGIRCLSCLSRPK